ncbi:MAG: glycosyltransferase family 2 protein [Planctomycetales bacterium]|nr:glycosyltransferase family 2 protein [Planctomycetales bacterium]
MSEPRFKISIIVPAYNEEDGIQAALERFIECIEKFDFAAELCVVDDGSRDRTWELAQQAVEGISWVRLIRHETNLGQVHAIQRGFAESQGEYVTHNGVDLMFDPAQTPLLVEAMEQGADVVVVERKDRSAYGIIRKVMSRANVALAKLLLKSPVHDHNFIQAYRREVIEAITIETDGVSTVTPEWIVKAFRMGYRVVSMKLPYHPRELGDSTITLKNTLHSILQLFRLARIVRKVPISEGRHANSATA